MKNVVKDNSAYQNALSARQSAISSSNTAEQRKIQLDYNNDVRELQKEQTSLQRTYNGISTALQFASIAVETGSSLYNIVQQSQSSSVQSAISTSLQEGQRLLQNSIANGTTYYGTNPTTGEAELIIAPEVEEWYNSSRDSISNGKYMSSVKESALQTFDLNYESLKTSANASVIEKYYSDLNTNFTTNLDLAKNADVQSYVASGGDIELWNASSTIQGIQAINSRSDWSTDARQAQTTAYLLDVQKEGDTQIASELARTQGLQAALDYIDSKGIYSVDERQKMFATASTSATYAKTAASEMAGAIMEDALTNGTATPEQVYAALIEQYGNSSPAVLASAKEAAILKQTEIVQNMVSNQLADDKIKGVSALYNTWQSFESGAWDDKFYNVEDVKASAISSYSTALSSAQEQIAKATASATDEIEAIDSTNKTAYTQFQEAQKIHLAQFEAGTISGEEYISAELSLMADFNSQYSSGGFKSTDYWQAETTNAAITAVQKVANGAIPSKYKAEVDNALDYLKNALSLNVTSTKMTAEQSKELYNANVALTGQFIDYIRDKGADMTPEEFSTWAMQKADDYVWLSRSSKYDKLLNGDYTVKASTTMAKRIDNFNDVIAISYGSAKDGTSAPGTYFVDWGDTFTYDPMTGSYAYVSKKDAGYTFTNENVEETWESMTILAKSQVKWLTGKDPDAMVYCDTDDDGHPIMSPIVVCDGTAYKFQNGKIQCSSFTQDATGNVSVVWQETGLKVVTDQGAMAEQVEKSNMPVVVENYKEQSDYADYLQNRGVTVDDSSVQSVYEWVKETPNSAQGDVVKEILLTKAESQKQLDSIVSTLNDAHEDGVFVPGMDNDEYNSWINKISDSITEARGWNNDPIGNERRAEEEAEQSGHVYAFTAYLDKLNGADKGGSATTGKNTYESAKEWAESNSTATPREVYQYLKELNESEREEAASTLKKEIDNNRNLPTSVKLRKKKTIDNYVKELKGDAE